MRLAVVSLTKNAAALGEKIVRRMAADHYSRWNSSEDKASVPSIPGKFTPFVGELFQKYEGLIFIMACGIVVRSIAGFLKDKKTDPAVLVIDEKGQYVISLLSGHYGGANQLARQIAKIISGRAVITTATDVNQVTSFDLFARKNGCVIENESRLKLLSAALVNGASIYLSTPYRLRGELPRQTRLVGHDQKSGEWAVVVDNDLGNRPPARQVLFIRPQNLILGIGCKKGTPKHAIEEAVADFLQKNQKSFLSVKKVASIQIKANEAGIIEYCKEHGLIFQTLSVAELLTVESQLTSSPFVKQTVGVGNVAEASALMGGDHTRLICGKTVYQGITLALAEEEKEFQW